MDAIGTYRQADDRNCCNTGRLMTGIALIQADRAKEVP